MLSDTRANLSAIASRFQLVAYFKSIEISNNKPNRSRISQLFGNLQIGLYRRRHARPDPPTHNLLADHRPQLLELPFIRLQESISNELYLRLHYIHFALRIVGNDIRRQGLPCIRNINREVHVHSGFTLRYTAA